MTAPCGLCGNTGQRPVALPGRVIRVPCAGCGASSAANSPDAWPMPQRWLVPALCLGWLALVVAMCALAVYASLSRP